MANYFIKTVFEETDTEMGAHESFSKFIERGREEIKYVLRTNDNELSHPLFHNGELVGMIDEDSIEIGFYDSEYQFHHGSVVKAMILRDNTTTYITILEGDEFITYPLSQLTIEGIFKLIDILGKWAVIRQKKFENMFTPDQVFQFGSKLLKCVANDDDGSYACNKCIFNGKCRNIVPDYLGECEGRYKGDGKDVYFICIKSINLNENNK